MAAELEASVERSIDTARDAMAREAASQDQRATIAAGLTRAAMHKLAVAESYMTMGRWPTSPAEIGVQSAESYAGQGLRGIALEGDGVVAVRYDDAFGTEAMIRLIPTAKLDIGSIEWRCVGSGFSDASLLPATCR